MKDNEKVLDVVATCPMCKGASQMELTRNEGNRLALYETGGFHIQDLFKDWSPFEREFLMTGYCVDCQSKIFGKKVPKDVRVKKVNPSAL